MKIYRSSKTVHVELSVAEARVLIEEMAHVRGGARLRKFKQVCEGLESTVALKVVDPPDNIARPKEACAACGSWAAQHRCPGAVEASDG